MSVATPTAALLLVTFLLTGAGCRDGRQVREPAAEGEGEERIEAEDSKQVPAWPVFRGDAQGTAAVPDVLPRELELLWKFTVPESTFTATAAIADGVVYVGNGNDALHAIDLSTGSELWKFEPAKVPLPREEQSDDQDPDEPGAATTEPAADPFPIGFTAPAAVKDQQVFVGDADGQFWCLEAKTGRPLWRYRTGGEINAGANFIDDAVLVGSQDGTLYRFQADTGKLEWKFTIEASGGIQSCPSFADNRALFGGCDQKLHAVDVARGSEVGEVEIGGPTLTSTALAGEFAYLGTESGEFLAVHQRSLQVGWKYPQQGDSLAAFRSSPAVSDSAIVVGNRNKQIIALARGDGRELWTYLTRGRVDSSPVIVGNRVFVGSADGTLYGLNLATGELQWRYEAGGSFVASPAVAEGRLVIGNENGTVYCFGRKQ